MINLSALTAIKSTKNNVDTQKTALRMNSYVQKPDTFEHTCPINFTGSSNRKKQYEKASNTLIVTGQNAQLSLDGQLASDGWAGKIADSVSSLWNSKNRAVLVQSDINAYNEQVGELKDSIKENKFPQKFKEIFGVEYKQANITKYNEKAYQFKMAVTSEAVSEIMNKTLSEDLEVFKKSNGKLEDRVEKRINPYAMTGCVPYFNHTIEKEQTFEKMEKSLIKIVGSKEALNETLKLSGMNAENMSMQEKYRAYGIMAEFLVETSNDMKEQSCKGKSVKDLKQEYDDAYTKAFGTENNIQSRVDKYNRSQEIGAAAVRGVSRSALLALASLAAPEAGLAKMVVQSLNVTGIKILVDGSDKLSNDVEGSMNFKNFKNLVRSASISGSENLATSILSSTIPTISTGYELLDEVCKQGKTVATETALGMVSEKLKKGKWAENQIIPRMLISFVFKNLGSDDEVVKQLLKCTKGGVSQAMKYSTRDNDVVKSFIEGTKQALDKIEVDDKQSIEEMKKMLKENPEEFLTIMTSVLQQVVEENKTN